ncbi:hypothetical protein [Pantoea sp.]|uniref:hypothetical protein n=1 Tax=Pantoea sp. TaxID=69393 RepID=UPI00289E40C8|nr:hypothetical protein [Pantoea sp.]
MTNDFGGLAAQPASKTAAATDAVNFFAVVAEGKIRELAMINSGSFWWSLGREHSLIIRI